MEEIASKFHEDCRIEAATNAEERAEISTANEVRESVVL